MLNKLDPKNATALYVRGLTYLSLKDTVSACNDFSESKKAGFDSRAFEEFSSLSHKADVVVGDNKSNTFEIGLSLS